MASAVDKNAENGQVGESRRAGLRYHEVAQDHRIASVGNVKLSAWQTDSAQSIAKRVRDAAGRENRKDV